MPQITFGKELESLLNRYSKENRSNTPDFLLAEYLIDCLKAYDNVLKKRDEWFNIDVWKEKECEPAN